MNTYHSYSMVNLNDITLCIYDKGTGSVNTVIDPRTGLEAYTSKTVEDYIGTNKDLFLCDFEVALNLVEQKDIEQYKVGQIKWVSREVWDEAFGCLPPERIERSKEGFTWMMSEALTGSFNRFYVRLYGSSSEQLFSVAMDRYKTTHEQLIQLAQEALKQ